MSINLLKLNSNNAEVLVEAPNALLQKTGHLLIDIDLELPTPDIDGFFIWPSLKVHSLGVILELSPIWTS